ncbi:MAG: TIGR03960 family B12-binding radical SAM protein, partial [Acutalibacteraceae bacterium]
MISREVEKILLNVQKPGRYTGGELNSVVKDKNKVDIRFAFCFPDVYEVGMSHLGMKILYGQFNEREDIWCERVFAPWTDMEEQMRKNNIPLYALESGDSLDKFDFIGFTLQYELSFTNILYMLELGNIPLLSKDRTDLFNIVVAGGPCACNPEPLADFIDLFFIGEGEEVDLEVMDLYKQCRANGETKQQFLEKAAQIQGVYVPALYEVEYNDDGTIKAFIPKNNAPAVIKKRIITDLDNLYYPESFVVPSIEIVHDRAMAEIFRGCIRGCRFCQAGFLYRPVREKSPEVIDRQCHLLCNNTGYDEVSLSSLSSSDYTKIGELLNNLTKWSKDENVSISLPSLRVDGFSDEILSKLKTVRKSGLTFAPEAGTQRLRDVINKNVTEEELMDTCSTAFNGGWTTVKLYFMIGLPTET